MSFQQKLLRWFEKSQRPLPWRRDYRPYDVWVSEIMLQQTQMDTVLPYFQRWMKAFPTLESLANADSERVLKHWQGLGYYSRARNLHAMAKKIRDEWRGQFPSDFDTIRSLKGVGRYTAGAIASIAFNEERPIVDGNVFRVLSRLYAVSKPIDIEKNREYFWELQSSLIPKGHARDFNQGLMELGALICTTKDPACTICPVMKYCLAYKNGDPEKYPFKAKRRKTVKIEASALALQDGERFFIHYRPIGGIMGGLWEFPEWKQKKLTENAVLRSLAVQMTGSKKIGTIKRNYTHHLETLSVFLSEIDPSQRPRSLWRSAWVSTKDFKKYPFSSAHAKIAELLTGLTKAE